MIYDFQHQLEIGKKGEARLDSIWRGFQIIDVSDDPEWQRRGVDRLLVLPDGRYVSVEYKLDNIAHRTGNLVFEILSNDITDTPGWGLSSKAEYLVYLVEQTNTVYLIRLPELRKWVIARMAEFRRVRADNGIYCTHSLLIPLRRLESLPFVKKLFLS